MESEDEEIIFENSALHKALMETGVENIDTEPLVSKDQGKSNEKTDTRMDEDDKFHRVHTDFFTKMVLSENELSSVHKRYQQRTLDRLKSSPLLSNDDTDFLQSFMDDETDTTESLKYLSIWSNLNLFRVMVCSIGFGMCLFVFLSYSMVDASQYLPDYLLMMGTDSFTVSVTSGFSLAFVLCLLKIIFFLKVCREMNRMDCIIQDFEESARKLSRIEGKCIRRIRESELAARGFTLASVSSCSSSDTHLLTQIDKLCPEFRASFIGGNLDIFGHLKDSYKYMTESIPLVVEFNWVDIKTDQIRAESRPTSSDSSGLDKSGTSVSDDGDNESQPSENFIRISQLASSQELLNIQLSTFMRRLVLSFYMKHYKDVLVNPYKAVSKSVLSCQKSMDSVTDVLNKNQSFYRAIHKTLRRRNVSDTPTKAKKSKSPLESFYVCVNSLDLHLEKVFDKTRDLTVHLESMVDEQEVSTTETHSDPFVGSISPEDRAAWEDNLKKIKLDLDLCKSCYEEGIKVLSRTEVKASPNNTIQPKNTQDASPLTNEQDTLQKRINLIPESEPVIEDQVFEAVIDSDGEEEEAPARPSYTAEQKAQIRQQREDLTRFKQELKAVVDHRAISQRKREEKALARTRGELPLNSTTETDESPVDLENNEADSSNQLVKNSEVSVDSQVEKLEMSNHEWDKVSSKSESALLDENKHGETFSMLAAKLDSADSNGYVNPTNSLPPWLSLAQKDGAAADSSQSSRSNRSKKSSSRSQQSAQALPYDEGWRSSIERSKARHWEMCEKIIQENKDAADSDNKQSDVTQPSQNDLDTSSFVDISSSDDLLFYPIDTEVHVENGARASVRPDKNSSSSSNSQLVFPCSVNPEEEGFRNVNGAYVSRHNFTASGKNYTIHNVLKGTAGKKRQDESQDEDDEEQVVHPNRKRHRAEKQSGGDTSKWVNISYVELMSGNGNQYNLYRQKDMTSDDIAKRNPNRIPSPEPGSSLNSSLAAMAAARARHFDLGVEEHFNDDGEADDMYDVLCSSGLSEMNGDLSREMPSEVA